VAAGVVNRLQSSDRLARFHVKTLTLALQRSHEALDAQKKQIDGLAGAIEAAGARISDLGEAGSPQLIAVLTRVKEAADDAAARAREAISQTVPEAAEALGTASAGAMEQAISRTVTDQMDKLAIVADNAVKTAHRATDKLNRQMLKLVDSSAELEQRMSANADLIERQDGEALSRRSKELIDSLNNRAFDVSKWLTADVGQSDWSNYLKGDRGFFTRRAVRLISNGEAREINHFYAEDETFREHVNRYIADFEILMKTVLATKDGSTLAITMLSSDIGKLYVALAQGINRLPPR
jgi:hypothetical protein